MGVRTKTVKKSRARHRREVLLAARVDFHTNKRICDEVAVVPSKRMRNKIAGFVTHLMKRIARGPVRGISLKLQEEEGRERRAWTSCPGRRRPSTGTWWKSTRTPTLHAGLQGPPGSRGRTRFNFRVHPFPGYA